MTPRLNEKTVQEADRHAATYSEFGAEGQLRARERELARKRQAGYSKRYRDAQRSLNTTRVHPAVMAEAKRQLARRPGSKLVIVSETEVRIV